MNLSFRGSQVIRNNSSCGLAFDGIHGHQVYFTQSVF